MKSMADYGFDGVCDEEEITTDDSDEMEKESMEYIAPSSLVDAQEAMRDPQTALEKENSTYPSNA